ncbi:MAG: CCA tRNA nucleotidyltransferase, partial [Acidobacteria bacterium]|nr:CCA tRNA nucleotidyltransferase [Acidobacteriota bacterium]
EKSRARIVSQDENRNSAELVFAGGVTAEIAMSRQERYPNIGGRPEVTPATIQEDLRRRDFSMNAIALSLHRASRGLLLDPANGLADIQRRELRALSNYGFYDDPSRLLRLVRFRVRFGCTVDERTRMQYDNAREAGMASHIPPRILFEELREIANDANPAAILQALEQDGLIGIFSPALAASKLSMASLAKLERAIRLLADANGMQFDRLGPFFWALTDNLTPREKAALVKSLEMRKPEVELWQKLDSRARKLETALRSARIKKPSQVYQILAEARGDEIVFLLCHSPHRTVQDRIRNHLQKYLPLVQETGSPLIGQLASRPGTPKYEKEKRALIADLLDRRRKPVEVAPLEPAPPLPVRPEPGARGRPGPPARQAAPTIFPQQK